MTITRLLSAALVATAVLATPALAAREHHAAARQRIERSTDDGALLGSAYAYEPYGYGSYAYQPACVPAPRVGAFATAPWDKAAPCEPYAYWGY